MENDKNERQDAAQPQTTQTGAQPINPFRDADNPEKEPTPEEQAESEQQLKEAMTERD